MSRRIAWQKFGKQNTQHPYAVLEESNQVRGMQKLNLGFICQD
jgi:hypothetical protein